MKYFFFTFKRSWDNCFIINLLYLNKLKYNKIIIKQIILKTHENKHKMLQIICIKNTKTVALKLYRAYKSTALYQIRMATPLGHPALAGNAQIAKSYRILTCALNVYTGLWIVHLRYIVIKSMIACYSMYFIRFLR